ncbi:hypothetical protein GCM10010430_71620 [Kitasatospora cystarginea]|uniref:Uncharacterized protein n=1 Tax=Kitasatospora cystarginea TaxID=58350 RepID=A0ABN3EXT7_9ACTN
MPAGWLVGAGLYAPPLDVAKPAGAAGPPMVPPFAMTEVLPLTSAA